MHRFHPTLALFLGATLAWPAAVLAQGATVYRCPGNVYTSSADISAKEAEAKGCKTIEGAPITVIQGQQPRPRSGRNCGPNRSTMPEPASQEMEGLSVANENFCDQFSASGRLR